MNVTREVILDLLPLYLSGEASSDTRTLVETFLEQDAELAELIRSGASVTLPASVAATLPEDAALKTLRTTRKVLRQRAYFLALAVLFSGLTVAFSFDATGIRWLWADTPQVAAATLLIAIVGWIGYLRTRIRLRETGL